MGRSFGIQTCLDVRGVTDQSPRVEDRPALPGGVGQVVNGLGPGAVILPASRALGRRYHEGRFGAVPGVVYDALAVSSKQCDRTLVILQAVRTL